MLTMPSISQRPAGSTIFAAGAVWWALAAALQADYVGQMQEGYCSPERESA